ncbi:transcription-repair coupling factor [Verrucomicrobia bacterium LW23]|nr:transcription-repair coupling factor [Verrucomicrobia bacterium LW23]
MKKNRRSTPHDASLWDQARKRWLGRPEWARAFKLLHKKGIASAIGLPTAAQALMILALAAERERKKSGGPVLLRVGKIRTQEELAHDLEAWGVPFLFLPQAERASAGTLPDQDLAAERLSVIGQLGPEFSGMLLLTEVARHQRLPAPDQVRTSRVVLTVGQETDRDALLQMLGNAGYHREVEVQDRGQFSVRGAVVDIFSWHSAVPVRSEWEGDEIVSLRHFDPNGQRSTDSLREAEFSLTDGQLPGETDEEGRLTGEADEDATLKDYLPQGFTEIVLELDGPRELEEREIEELDLEFFAHDFLHAGSNDFILQEKRRDLFLDHLLDWMTEGWEIAIFCNSEGEQKRLQEILEDAKLSGERVQYYIRPLMRGFVWPAGRLVVLSDSEIFGRYQTMRSQRRQERLASLRSGHQLLDYSEIQDGDYVVHTQHGIALYCGVQRIPGEGGAEGETEALLLEFAEGAKLYVPVEQAYLVSKYVGVGKRHPPLDVLGGSRWEKARAAARRAVMDYAATLLKTAAERDLHPGHTFPEDTPWQAQFEEAFIYEETEDQLKAILDVKRDMQSARAMDRLICGDVGFGKTEVAIRAAFKAVLGQKQVAFFVPTTVLAQQHAKNMQERFAAYPITVDVLSRFRSAKEQREIIAKVADGSLDIVVGTHRLLSKDVSFKELGLVVVDEEQRFGVVQKEKFKQLFRNVDVITLSATPIPRTLYLSLTGARDMSLIETPPANRQPVETIIGGYDERVIREAIQRELARGGQVYFLHNRVQTIYGVADRLKLLVPEARIVVGHGQMETDELEVVMQQFVTGQADVLLSTTIIESGLDIPNANTILIDRADLFGLADLYQLRGRVGRSGNKAYAYLFLPRHLMAVGDAKKRVSAIKQYSQLGAGFKIAMRDLEIRGAGNLLGTAQSGHITAVGFDLYCQLLKQAVASLRGETTTRRVETRLLLDFLVWQEADLDAVHAGAYLPASYLTESRWRIEGYRRMAELGSVDDMRLLQQEWRDRYGAWPEPVALLWLATEIKIRASAVRVSVVETQGAKLILKTAGGGGGDYLMVGDKFPRLHKVKPAEKLREILHWLEVLGKR